MSCKFCSTQRERKKAKMFISRPIKDDLIEKVDTFIRKNDKGDTQLVFQGFSGFERNEDCIDEISLHIRFCPFCGKKIGC